MQGRKSSSDAPPTAAGPAWPSALRLLARLAWWAVLRALLLPFASKRSRGTLRLAVLVCSDARQAQHLHQQAQRLVQYAAQCLASECGLTVQVAWDTAPRLDAFDCAPHGYRQPSFWIAERVAAKAIRRHRANIAVLVVPRLNGNTTGCYMPGAAFVAVDGRADAEVLAHELGHAAGLDHRKDPENLMGTGHARHGARLTKQQRRWIGSMPYRFIRF